MAILNNYLVVCAHCDDPELWIGGTILRLRKSNIKVIVLILYSSTERRNEAEKSALELGYELYFCKKLNAIDETIRDFLEKYQPEVLFTHSYNDSHLEHRNTYLFVEKALMRLSTRKFYPKRWYSFDTYYLTNNMILPSILIDISEFFEQKVAALHCHKSQNPEELVLMAKNMNALQGQRIRVKYAEAFYVFPLLGRLPALRELP